MATPNIVPRADSEGGLGTASKYWASAYIDTITTTSHIVMPDNAELKFGAGSDLKIYHDGTNSYIDDTGTGELRVRGSSIRLQANENENAIICNANGSVDLYHDGSASPKLSTTSTGVSISGDIDSSGNPFRIKGAGDVQIHLDDDDNNLSTFSIFNGADSSIFTVSESGVTNATSYNGIPFFSDAANNSM